MKKLFALVLSAVMIAAFAGCGSKTASNTENTSTAETSATEAQPTQATQATLSADVKTKLDQALAKEKFKGVAQITKGDDIIYQYVNGDDDNGKPLTIDSSLPIASVSKQFCAAAVIKLCDENKLSVDDTLDKYFPDYKNGKKIKIKDLLTMSSGIPNYNAFLDPSMLGTNEEENIKNIKEAIFGEDLNSEPGNDFEYSNSNFFLLADIVNQVSGDIVTNAADMDKWMRGLSGGKIISSEAYKQMTGNPNPNSSNGYSYGLWQMPFDGMGHVGQIEPHFGAVDYLNTDRGVYLFAAANTMRGLSFVEQIPQTLLNILFDNE